MENNILINLFDLQTRLFNNVIAGMNDTHAATGADNKTNHVKWLAGHLVSARHLIAALLGAPVKETYADLYSEFKGLQKNAAYPSVEALKTEWAKITATVRPLLANAKKETLDAPAPFPVPVADQNIGGFITFTLHHEAYHLGQMGLLRRYHGYEAMQYN